MSRCRPLGLAPALAGVVAAAAAGGSDTQADDAVDAATALATVATSIRSAPTRIEGEVTIQTKVDGGGSREVVEDFSFSVLPGRTGRIEYGPWRCGLADGAVTIVHDGSPHFYWRTDDDGSPYYTMLAAIPDLPLPMMAMCFGEESGTDLAMQYHWKAPWLTPSSVEKDPVTGDTTAIHLVSDAAVGVLRLDPASHLPTSGEVTLQGGEAIASGTTVTYRYDYDVIRLPQETTAAAVSVAIGSRQRAGELSSLLPKPSGRSSQRSVSALAVGSRAPDLMLATCEGAAVSIDDFPGQYIVVDFWASWCGPCMRTLPHLQKAADSLAKEGAPVTVVTVNIAERVHPDEADKVAARHTIIDAAKEKIGLTLPVLVDYDGAVAKSWSISTIPRSFIIDPDGVIVATCGSSLDYLTWIREAMADSGADQDQPQSPDG